MNKKVIISICISIILLLVCICLVIIVKNSNKDKRVESSNQSGENANIEENSSNDNNENNSSSTENIVVNSKIGNEISNVIAVPNIYSQYFFTQIEASGLDDKAKIMFTFAKMFTDENKYSNMLRQSENYVGSYVTADDLQKVASSLFENASNLKNQSVFLDSSYDEKDQNYIQPSTGFVDFSYIKDVPYKMEQLGDKITVYVYRLYIDCNSSDIEDTQSNSKQIIYYDSNRTKQALTVSDENMDNETKQLEYLNGIISSGKIEKSNLKQGKYTLIKKGNNYLIEDIK